MEIIESSKSTSSKEVIASVVEKALFPMFDTFIRQRNSINPLLLKTVQVVEILQIIAISLFSLGSKQFSDCIVTGWLAYLADAILMFPYLPKDYSTVLTANALALGILLTNFLLCIMPVLLSNQGNTRRTFFRVAFWVATIASSVLYLPILGISLVPLSCHEEGILRHSVMDIDHRVECGAGQYIGLVTVSVVCICTLFFTALLYKLFIFMHEPSLQDLGGKAGPGFDVITLLIKTAAFMLVVILSSHEDGRGGPELAICEGASLIAIAVVKLRYSVVYKADGDSLLKAIAWLGAWVGIVEILVRIVGQFKAATLGGVIFCGALIVYFVLNSEPPECALRAVSLRIHKKLHEAQAVVQLVAVLNLYLKCLQGGALNDALALCYLRSYVEHHVEELGLTKELALANKLSLRKHRKEVLQALMCCINRTFKEVLLKNPEFIQLRLLYVGFLVNYSKNHILAWEINEGTSGYKLNVIQRLHIYRYKRIIKESITQPENWQSTDAIEPLEIALCTRRAEKARKLIEQNAVIYGQFWDTLLDRAPLYERFVLLGSTFLRINKRIKDTWKRLTAANSKLPCKLVAMYALYVDEILQDEKRAEAVKEYLDRPELLIQPDTIFQHVGQGNSVVAVSADARQVGKIKNFNAALCELTGYTKDELKDMDMIKLVPQLYQERHSQMFPKFCSIANGGIQLEKMGRDTFVLHKSQYLIPANIQAVATPNYTNNYCFLVKLRKSLAKNEFGNSNVYHILATPDMLISGATSNLYEIFGIDIGQIRASSVSINNVLPAMHAAEDHIPIRTKLFLPSPGSGPSGGDKSLFPILRSCSLVSYEERLEVICERSRVRAFGSDLLGYHYKFTRCEPEQDESLSFPALPGSTGGNTVYSRTDKSWTEFAYSYSQGGFYQTYTKTCEVSIPYFVHEKRLRRTSVVSYSSPREESKVDIEDLERLERGLPKFYQQLVSQAKKIRDCTGDAYLLALILRQPNFEKGVALWRFGPNGPAPVEGRSATYETDLAALANLEGLGKNPGHSLLENKDSLTKNEFILKNSLRNKGNLKKLVKSIFVPWVFLRLVLASVFVMFVSIVTIVCIYVIFNELFNNLNEQVRMILFQMNSVEYSHEAASLSLQVACANDGLVRPENAYPPSKSVEELAVWTSAKLRRNVQSMNDCLLAMKNSPYELLTKWFYERAVIYFNNGTDVKFTNLPLITSYGLLLQDMLTVGNYVNASQYYFKNAALASLNFNIKNDVFNNMFAVTKLFMQSVDALYKEQQKNTQTIIIVLCCLFMLLVCIQTPTAYSLAQTVFSQVDIFLKVPNRTCIKLERLANQFVLKVQKNDSDEEAVSLLNSSQDEVMSASGHNKQLQVNQGFDDVLGKHPSGHNALQEKQFYRPFNLRVAFIWRVLITFLVPSITVIVMCVIVFDNYSYMNDVIQFTNTTNRMQLTGAVAHDFYRLYYYDPTVPVLMANTTAQYVPYYNNRQADIIRDIFIMIEENPSFVKTNKPFVRFLRKTMCIPELNVSRYCEDTVALRGYFAIIAEFNWLQRYIRLTYSARDRAVVFNTPEYVRTMHLYYDFLKPGSQYICGELVNEVAASTSFVKTTLIAGTVVITAFAVVFMLLGWLPYVSEKKRELLRLRLLILFLPVGAIGKVKELREYFANLLFKQNGEQSKHQQKAFIFNAHRCKQSL